MKDLYGSKVIVSDKGKSSVYSVNENTREREVESQKDKDRELLVEFADWFNYPISQTEINNFLNQKYKQ